MTWNIADQQVLITGGSSGIGQAAAKALAQKGARITITSRDAERGQAAAQTISDATGNAVKSAVLDLADLDSVREFASSYSASTDHIGVLINNAGGVFGSRRQSSDGFELTFATNHLGPFLLTSLLADKLGGSSPSRVINTASVAHTYAREGILFDDLGWQDRRYRTMHVYGHSKLANILHARELNQRTGDDVTAVAVHPGLVGTDFGGRGGSLLVRAATKFGRRWMRTPDEGADTIIWLATDASIDIANGIYFSDRKVDMSTRYAKDAEQARRLWSVSEALVGIDSLEP